MKKLFFLWATLLFSFATYAQEPKFSVKASKTTVNTNTKFKVEFILENADNAQFQAPDFENFTIVEGPNQYSEMSITNGKILRKMTYTYILMPKKIGNFVLAKASVKLKTETLKTEEVKIIVNEASDEADDEADDEAAAMEENERIKPQNPSMQNPFGSDLFEQFFRQMPRQAPKREDGSKKRKSYNL